MIHAFWSLFIYDVSEDRGKMTWLKFLFCFFIMW